MIKRFLHVCACIMSVCLISGCTGRGSVTLAETTEAITTTQLEATSETTTEESTEAPTEPITEAPTEPVKTQKELEMETYEALFDINNKIVIEIQISDAELKKLNKDHSKYTKMNSKSPIYRIAQSVRITIGDETYEYEEVGLRQKGNYSRTPLTNGAGVPNLWHYRMSFDETFDDETYYGSEAKVWEPDERKERKKRTFAALSGLELRYDRNYDATHLREWYTGQYYAAMGIVAQRMNLCQIIVNGNNYGVYTMYEPVDKKFIEHHLPEEEWGGDLYKCGTKRGVSQATFVSATASYGVADADDVLFYNYNLKTNKTTSQHEELINTLKTVNTKPLTKELLESVVDMDYFVKFLAAGYFTGNPDDYRNNYNNYYTYFLKSSGKAIFIPYDNDRTFGVTFEWNADGSGMTAYSPYAELAQGKKNLQQNPITRSTVLPGSLYFEDYKRELEVASQSEWLKPATFASYFEIAKNNYQDVVEPYRTMGNQYHRFAFGLSGNYNMSFEKYITKKLAAYNSQK